MCFFLLTISPSQPVNASEEKKQMAIDVSSSVGSQQNFTVSVYDINATNETPSPYLVGVTIIFNNQTNHISSIDEDGEISLSAPQVTENKSFTLVAQKQGYLNATATIIVTPFVTTTVKQLYINSQEFTVEAEEEFTITVYDETGTPIAGATVGIQNHIETGSMSVTDSQGQAFLQAPNEAKITLIAQKQGYKDATENLWVDTNPGFFNELFSHPYTVIIVAGIVLILSIIYITFFNKNKTRSLPSSKQYQKSKTKTEPTLFPKEKTVKPKSNISSSKVEEIRITRQQPHKKIVPIQHNPINNNSTHNKEKNDPDTWYKGNQELGHTIDKVTKNKDENKKDRWFAGTTDIQQKIDEALKEKQMKQKKKEDK